MSDDKPALLLIGHGSRSEAGVAEFWDFTKVLQSEAPDIAMEFGFIELAEPHLDTALDELVARGPCHVIGVPLVLLGAGHMKNDGPACLERARRRHPEVRFTYGTEMGIHPLALSVAEDRAMEVVTDDSPYKICADITKDFQKLVGLRLVAGFNQRVKERLGGTKGCTHLVELMGPIATAAYQTVFTAKGGGKWRDPAAGDKRKPRFLDTCHALASDSPVVKQYWPDFYKGPDSA